MTDLPWTPAEDKTLTLARAAGMTFEQCAEYLPGRSGAACNTRALKLLPPTNKVQTFLAAEFEAEDGSRRLLRAQLKAGVLPMKDRGALAILRKAHGVAA